MPALLCSKLELCARFRTKRLRPLQQQQAASSVQEQISYWSPQLLLHDQHDHSGRSSVHTDEQHNRVTTAAHRNMHNQQRALLPQVVGTRHLSSRAPGAALQVADIILLPAGHRQGKYYSTFQLVQGAAQGTSTAIGKA